MDNIGFRVLPKVTKISDEILEQYQDFVTPHLSDNMNRLYAVGASIYPFHSKGKLIGRAITVKTRPGDNLLINKAIDIAGSDDVIIVDGGGDLTNALIGEIMVRLALKKDIRGFVIDGSIRDSEDIRKLNFPVYAKGVTHRGPYKEGPGEINVPIRIGGLIVHPGDLIFGDMDGVIAIPAEHAFSLAEKVRVTIEYEKQIMNEIEDGTIDRTWVDKLLKQKGCQGI